MEIMSGFKAAAAGEKRDPTKSADWLEGFDGFHEGRAANQAAQDKHDAYMRSSEYVTARKALKAKLRRRCHSTTPRTL